MAQASTHWNVGDVILDLYKVTGILGEGGFGKVYKVYHQGWNVDLAVKSPKPEIVAAAGGVESFEREAETWVNLGLHPHTVSCYYVRRIENSPLVFAEYVAGGSLADWIENRRLYEGGAEVALKRILDIAIQFAWGLHYAHEQGLIHQDVKPANVMMTPQGMVKVTDFGLAKGRMNAPVHQGGEEGTHTLITEGSGAMTPAYCSPEQVSRESLTRRTDLWSWAVSVLEMFQGERTWSSGIVAAEALESYLEMGQDDPLLPQMPESVAELLRCCFRENPDERLRTMLDVANELKGLYQQVTGKIYPREKAETAKDIADSLNNRAVSLLDLGKQEEALQLWEQALQVQPQHPESTYNRGLVLWRTLKINNDTLIVKELEKMRSFYPNYWVAHYLLGLVHLERYDFDATIKALESIPSEQAELEEVQKLMKLTRANLPQQVLCTLQRHTYSIKGHRHPTDAVDSVYLGTSSFALSGSQYNGTLTLREVATGRCIRTFEGHTKRVDAVCLSTDGRFALSGSWDQTIKFWEVATGRCIRTFEGHTGFINSVCFNADNHFALSASPTTLKLWEVATGHCILTLGGDAESISINSACLSADARFALSGGNDKTLKLWDMATGYCIRTFEGHTSLIDSVCLSIDSRFAVSGSHDRTIKLWEVETGICIRTLEGHRKPIKSVCLSADSRFVLSVSCTTLKLWEVATSRCLHTLTYSGNIYQQNVVSLIAALSGLKVDGGTNSYLAPMQLCRIQATETALSIQLTYERELEQAQAAFAQGDYVTAAQHIRKARSQPGYRYDMKGFNAWTKLYICLPRKAVLVGWKQATLEGHTGKVHAVSLSIDERLALSGSRDKTLKLWETATGRCLQTFVGHTDIVKSTSLSADSRFALSGSLDKTLKLWETATGRCLRTFVGHTDSVLSVGLSIDGRLALSGSSDNTIKLWEVATALCLRTFEGHLKGDMANGVKSVTLSADSSLILSGGADNTIKLWEVATGLCLWTLEGHRDTGISVSLSADSRFALSGGWHDTLKLSEVATGRCLRNFAIDNLRGGVTSVSLSADDRFALSGIGDEDKTMKLWEVATGDCLLTLEGQNPLTKEQSAPIKGWGVYPNKVTLSARGRLVLSGGWDNTLNLWVLDWELEDKPPADWDEGTRPYLQNFLTIHTPYAATLPEDREPTEEEITLALTRRGTPTWTEEDFQNLLYTLGCAGYGWLRPEGVRQQLEAMAAIEPKPSGLVGNSLSSAHVPSMSAQTPQIPASPHETVALTEQFPESSSVESKAPDGLPEPPSLLPEPVAEQIQPASSPAPSEIESTPERRSQVSPFTRTNRVTVVTFLASYTFLAILMQSIWSLGWLGSLLFPIVPALLLALCLSTLFNSSRR